MKKLMRMAALIFGIFALTLFSALSVFLNTAADGTLYYKIQTSENVYPGVDHETMRDLDMLLAEYLAGDADALDKTEMFNADEKAHMEDVYALFTLARGVRNAAFVLGVLILAAVYYRRATYTQLQLRLGIIGGVALFLLPFAALGVWAALDFDGAFTAMHRALFSNDLWLMNPSTDLMIRMLPERFFVSMGGTLAARSGIAALAAPLVIFMGTLDWKRLGERLSTLKKA